MKGQLLPIVGLALLTIWLAGAVWLVGYAGRVNLRNAQLVECERGKQDRRSNAQAWRAAEKARRAGTTPLDYQTADLYSDVATGLEKRAKVVCTREFPKPSLLL